MSEATDDLLKRLDKLERFGPAYRPTPAGGVSLGMKKDHYSNWWSVEQVKETVRQWIADQEGKR